MKALLISLALALALAVALVVTAPIESKPSPELVVRPHYGEQQTVDASVIQFAPGAQHLQPAVSPQGSLNK